MQGIGRLTLQLLDQSINFQFEHCVTRAYRIFQSKPINDIYLAMVGADKPGTLQLLCGINHALVWQAESAGNELHRRCERVRGNSVEGT